MDQVSKSKANENICERALTVGGEEVSRDMARFLPVSVFGWFGCEMADFPVGIPSKSHKSGCQL